MFCCKEFRKSKFCPECGFPINTNTAQVSLLNYLEEQAAKVSHTYETRVKNDPDMKDSTKEKYAQKVEKWRHWANWVRNAKYET